MKFLCSFCCIYFLFVTFVSAQKIETISQKEQVFSISEKANHYLETLQIHYKKGDYDLHKAYSDSLYAIAKENDLTKMHVLALTNQAVFFKNQGQLQKAIENYYEALEKCKLIPNDHRAKLIVLVNMGNTYHRIGSYTKANKTMKEVLSTAHKLKKPDKIKAAALLGISNNYAELNEYNNSLVYADSARILGEKMNNEGIIITSINSISESYLELGQYEKALEIISPALEIASLKNPTKKRATALLTIGIANFHLNNIDKSFTTLKECRELSQDKKLLEIEMVSYEYLAKIYELKNDFKASYEAQKKYSRLRNTLLTQTNKANSTDLKKDIVAKNEKIELNNQKLRMSANNKRKILLSSGLIVLILITSLYFYARKKKQIEREQKKLRSQYQELKESIRQIDSNATSSIFNKIPDLEIKSVSYQNSSLTPEDYEKYKKSILSYIEKEKPYLNPDLKQVDLAKDLGLTSHHFSEILNFCFNQNFYNFINSYRVLEAQNLMKKASYSNAKIIAIAFDAGFKSKTSFNRVFKKHSGSTPSDYKKSI